MHKYIHYILLGEKTQHYQIRGTNYDIAVHVFNEKDLENFSGWCGTRKHIVYCDTHFKNKKYKNFLTIIKDELCLKGSNKDIIFI